MALENANYIPELDPVNPDGNDPIAQGDDHLRTVKRSVLNSFPGFVGTTAVPKGVTLTEDQLNDAAQKSVTNIFTVEQQLFNNIPLQGRIAASTGAKDLVKLSGSDIVTVGDPTVNTSMVADTSIQGVIGGVTGFAVTDLNSGGAVVFDRTAVARKAGFRNPAIVTAAAAGFLLTQDHEETALSVTTATMVADQLEISTQMALFVADQQTVVDGVTNGVTFTYYDASGSRPSGSTLTIAGASVVGLFWRSASNVYVYGNGVTVS